MAIYRYPHESLVDSVHLLMNEKGGLRAYLYADNGAESEKLRLLKQSLRAEGYKCVPTLQDGKPVLEVRGYKKNEELINYLTGMRAVTGKPEVTAEPSDVRTRKQKWENATLRTAGISYNIGDAAYMIYSAGPVIDKVKRGKKLNIFDALEIASGIGYGLGSYCLTFFGAKDQSINTITSATSKIERFARKEGYQIAPESSIAFVNEKKDLGPWGNLKQLIGRYPTESLNSIYVGVGACITAAAIHRGMKPVTATAIKDELAELTADLNQDIKWFEKAGKSDKALAAQKRRDDLNLDNVEKHLKTELLSDRMDIGLGAITAASAITGLAVKEQKRMEGDPKRHGIGGVVDWIKEKPLRATGYGYMVATLCHAAATVPKWKNRTVSGKGKTYLMGRVVFIATNLLSERLMAISSKGHGVGVKPDASIDESIISTAAELVLRQPADKREEVITQMSGYIASRDVLATQPDIIEASIRQHLAELDKNPWTKHYVPTASGEMVEAAPEATSPAPAILSAEPSQKPSTVVSNAEHIAKQQEFQHAVA